MARRAKARESVSRYSLKFGTVAFILVSGTLVLVLFVLPQRYVLHPGFRESGATFPAAATPFAPYPMIPVTAFVFPEPPGPPPTFPPGPAEIFWREVVPLLELGRYSEAIPLFDRYLREHPSDHDARRERAVTLLAAGRAAEGVEEIERLLALRNDPDLRLRLARALRDLRRVDAAAAEYRRLSEESPNDVGLVLEWAEAYAWAERYAEAAEVLEEGLARAPTSVPTRVALARVYYSSNELEQARALLASVGDDDLAAAGALSLRDGILAALYVPPPPPVSPPTPLQLAATAREADDFERARTILEDALRTTPDETALWQAYADLLEYEVSDFEGAYRALLEVERIEEPNPDAQYRLAQLEIWTGRNEYAERRLVVLLGMLDHGTDNPVVTRADVEATLGDLRRWEGDRLGASSRYRLALADDPTNAQAQAGVVALDTEVARQLVEIEAPRLGGTAYSIGDTDEFARLDLAGEWVDVSGPWVWGGSVGNRWLSGRAWSGGNALRQGGYTELEGGRWWSMGTVRTALDLGVQHLHDGWEVSLGGSLAHRSSEGSTSELRYEHGPAYPIAVTLQSVLADVVHDRVSMNHARRVGDRWSLSGAADATWLRADAASVAGGSGTASTRFQATLTIGRPVSPALTIGLATRSLGFTHASPVSALSGGAPLRLFWDPRFVLSAAPYVQVSQDLSPSWKLTGNLGPGVALIDERGTPGSNIVPHVSAEAGMRHEGQRYWTALDLFYYQGQFDGYRTYGARLTLSARDFSALVGR